MKTLFSTIVALLLTSYCLAQHVYQINADSVRIYSNCDTAELILENHTQNTLGFLFNKGKGRTQFQRLQLGTPSPGLLSILGQDTINLGLDTRYDLLSTNFYTIPQDSSWIWSRWPSSKVVGYDAYRSPDMPVLSNQSFNKAGQSLYYNGLVVRDGNTGFDMAVNWDGELSGPNGVFVRTKDDTQQAWSAWRELVFKDYADTAYKSQGGGDGTLQAVTDNGNSTTNNIILAGSDSIGVTNRLKYNANTVTTAEIGARKDTLAKQSSDLYFSTFTNSTSGLTEKMRIKANGNVGIGTANPNGKLDVNGLLRISATPGIKPAFPTSGTGLEIFYSEGIGGAIYSSNRTTGAPAPVTILGGDVILIADNAITAKSQMVFEGYVQGLSAEFSDDLSTNNLNAQHYSSTASAAGVPVFSPNANINSMLGVGYTVTVTGTDAFMRVSITTGTGITTSGAIGKIVFPSNAITSPPAVVWSANNANALDAKLGFGCDDNSGLTIFNKAVLTQATTYTYSIMVGGFY